jgi:hypothetical protein
MVVRAPPSGNPRAAPLPISSGSRMRSNPLVIVRGAHTGDPMADTLQLHPAFGLFLYEFDGTGQAVSSVRPAQHITSVPDPTAPPRRDVHQMPDHPWGWILAPGLDQPARVAPTTTWIIRPWGPIATLPGPAFELESN